MIILKILPDSLLKYKTNIGKKASQYQLSSHKIRNLFSLIVFSIIQIHSTRKSFQIMFLRLMPPNINQSRLQYNLKNILNNRPFFMHLKIHRRTPFWMDLSSKRDNWIHHHLLNPLTNNPSMNLFSKRKNWIRHRQLKSLPNRHSRLHNNTKDMYAWTLFRIQWMLPSISKLI